MMQCDAEGESSPCWMTWGSQQISLLVLLQTESVWAPHHPVVCAEIHKLVYKANCGCRLLNSVMTCDCSHILCVCAVRTHVRVI